MIHRLVSLLVVGSVAACSTGYLEPSALARQAATRVHHLPLGDAKNIARAVLSERHRFDPEHDADLSIRTVEEGRTQDGAEYPTVIARDGRSTKHVHRVGVRYTVRFQPTGDDDDVFTIKVIATVNDEWTRKPTERRPHWVQPEADRLELAIDAKLSEAEQALATRTLP